MTIDLSTIARRFQPAVVLENVSKLVKRIEERQARRPRRERRSMNG